MRLQGLRPHSAAFLRLLHVDDSAWLKDMHSAEVGTCPALHARAAVPANEAAAAVAAAAVARVHRRDRRVCSPALEAPAPGKKGEEPLRGGAVLGELIGERSSDWRIDRRPNHTDARRALHKALGPQKLFVPACLQLKPQD